MQTPLQSKSNDFSLIASCFLGIIELPPRRETSKRKAKERIPKRVVEISDEEEQGDSDSDPAWTPAATLIGEEEEKKKKRGRPVISKKSKRLLDEEGYSSGDVVVLKSRGRKKNDGSSSSKMSCKIDEKLLAAVSDEDIDISPFKVIYSFSFLRILGLNK